MNWPAALLATEPNVTALSATELFEARMPVQFASNMRVSRPGSSSTVSVDSSVMVSFVMGLNSLIDGVLLFGWRLTANRWSYYIEWIVILALPLRYHPDVGKRRFGLGPASRLGVSSATWGT